MDAISSKARRWRYVLDLGCLMKFMMDADYNNVLEYEKIGPRMGCCDKYRYWGTHSVSFPSEAPIMATHPPRGMISAP